MKTALELLGHSSDCGPNCCCNDLDESMHDALARVARLAREEMREAAANEALMSMDTRANLSAAIRALPVTP